VADALELTPLVAPVPFVSETLVLPLADETSGVRVDVVFSYEGFERTAIGRARPVTILAQDVRFCAVEDLVVLKMVAGRPRDLEDVRGVLLRNPAVDLAHVRAWLRQFDEALGTESVRLLDDVLAANRP
jgi:hypothetical protein